MKSSVRSLIGWGSSFLLILCLVIYYQQTQKIYFDQISLKHHTLQKDLKLLKNDLDFLEKNHSQLNDLINKGWFLPKNRLMAGENIYNRGSSFNALRLTIEPETIKNINSECSLKISKIIIEIDALLDIHLYDFTKNILKNFPGILILRKFSVSRQEIINNNLFALREKRRPHVVTGEIICEWISMEIEKHEEN